MSRRRSAGCRGIMATAACRGGPVSRWQAGTCNAAAAKGKSKRPTSAINMKGCGLLGELVPERAQRACNANMHRGCGCPPRTWATSARDTPRLHKGACPRANHYGAKNACARPVLRSLTGNLVPPKLPGPWHPQLTAPLSIETQATMSVHASGIPRSGKMLVRPPPVSCARAICRYLTTPVANMSLFDFTRRPSSIIGCV